MTLRNITQALKRSGLKITLYIFISELRIQYAPTVMTNANLSTNEVIVQLSPVGRDLKLLHMNNFDEAISTNQNLSSIPVADGVKILQVLYVATGCNFTSFFVGIGKAPFLQCFFLFSRFISGQCVNQSGTLTNLDPGCNGFLAF